jgi:hypothetical protein
MSMSTHLMLGEMDGNLLREVDKDRAVRCAP